MLSNRDDKDNINAVVFGGNSDEMREIIDKLSVKTGHLVIIRECKSGGKFITNTYREKTGNHGSNTDSSTKDLNDFKSFVIPENMKAILFVEGSEDDKQYLKQSTPEGCIFIAYDASSMTPDSYIDNIIVDTAGEELVSSTNCRIKLLFAVALFNENNRFNMDIIRHLADMLIKVTFTNKLALLGLFQSKENSEKFNEIDIVESKQRCIIQ